MCHMVISQLKLSIARLETPRTYTAVSVVSWTPTPSHPKMIPILNHKSRNPPPKKLLEPKITKLN